MRIFRKGMRKIGNVQSTATIKAKKLLRRLDKEKDEAKTIEKEQTNVERNSRNTCIGW